MQLLLRQRVQRRLPIMLADIVAHCLTVVPLTQQLAQLRQNLALMVILLRHGYALIQVVFGSAKVARQQRRIAFEPQIVLDSRPHFRVLLRG